MQEEVIKLYTLDIHYVDIVQKNLRHAILEGPRDVNNKIKFLKHLIGEEREKKITSMASKHSKEIFLSHQKARIDVLISKIEQLQMYLEECRSQTIRFGTLHHQIQAETIQNIQPTESTLNSRLQKVQLRFLGLFGRSLVDTLLEHNQNVHEEKNAECSWQMSSLICKFCWIIMLILITLLFRQFGWKLQISFGYRYFSII